MNLGWFIDVFAENTEDYDKGSDRIKIRTPKDDSLWEVYLQILGLGIDFGSGLDIWELLVEDLFLFAKGHLSKVWSADPQ